MTGAQLLRKALNDAGINYIFGYTGGAIMPFYDEMEKEESKTHVIMARHEQGAGFMAQGVTRASITNDKQEIGACITTSGPGAMNLVTAVADAIMDSTAMIAITGQVSTGVIGSDAFQETDVVGVMMPITKQTYMPTKVEEVEENLHEALYVAKSGRPGPVLIDLPKDIQVGQVSENYKFDFENYKPNIPGYKVANKPDPKSIEEAIELINKSEKPVIFCGHGVRLSNSGAELVKFAEAINSPISTTLHGISSFSSDHPLYLGWMGMHGKVEANRAIQNCDLIISFGMRFDDRVTGKLNEYAKNADVIHVEIDPSEIDKNVKTTIAINADAKEALMAFNSSPNLQRMERKEWFEQIETFKHETGEWHDEELSRGTGKTGKLLMKTIVKKMSDMTEGKDILVMDVGQQQMISSKYYEFKRVNTCFNSGGAGTMGVSLPMAIGVKLVRPNERVWSISGDGGFQMNIQELAIVRDMKLDIKVVVMNNGYLGMVRQWQTLFFDGRYAGTPMTGPNLADIAKAYSLPYHRCEKVEDIEKTIGEILNESGPSLTEFICDPSEIVLPMIPSGARFEDMIVNPPKTDDRS